MRALRTLFCAAALLACLAPGAGADEYTKQTILTFSGPVQLPGITLAAGTYQFRLADPDSGRRVLQVWDKDGSKLLTTLLTIPDRRMTPTDEPVVMFAERPSGQPQAIRAWFYPNESYGQEFVYPKSQAMQIARETHSSVLSYEGDAKDEAAFKSAKVDRIDANGNVSDTDVTADNSNANSPRSSAPAATTADNANTANANMPSANSAAPAGTGTSNAVANNPAIAANNPTSEANRDNTNIDQRAVGTSGTSSAPAATGQAGSGANAAAAQRDTLPNTASSTLLIQLLAGLSLAGAVALRIFRLRAAESR
jgi:hypothetical protein